MTQEEITPDFMMWHPSDEHDKEGVLLVIHPATERVFLGHETFSVPHIRNLVAELTSALAVIDGQPATVPPEQVVFTLETNEEGKGDDEESDSEKCEGHCFHIIRDREGHLKLLGAVPPGRAGEASELMSLAGIYQF